MDTTVADQFTKFLAARSTAEEFAAAGAAATPPGPDGVADTSRPAGRAANRLIVVPFGTGPQNATFILRLVGWRKAGTIWVPSLLCEVDCALSTARGLAGGPVTDVDRFADALNVLRGNAGVSVEAVSPGVNLIAHLAVDVKGFPLVQADFSIDTDATGMNALYAVA